MSRPPRKQPKHSNQPNQPRPLRHVPAAPPPEPADDEDDDQWDDVPEPEDDDDGYEGERSLNRLDAGETPEDDDRDGWDDDDEDAPAEDRRRRDGHKGASGDGAEYTIASYLAGERIPLPSGKFVRVEPVSLITLLSHGQVPNTLAASAKRLLYGNNLAPSSRPSAAPRTFDAESTNALIDWLVTKMVTSFRVVNKPQSKCGPDELSVSRIWDGDKNAIVDYAMRGQRALATFR